MNRSVTGEYVIVGIGELLWDLLPGNKRLGGAPANFAVHAGAMGALSAVVSAVGNDAPGREILDALGQKKIESRYIARNPHPTGCVNVKLDEDGNPSYQIALDTAWDHLESSPRTQALAATCDAVCFGTLAQRTSTSRQAVHAFLSATGAHCLRIFDINLRQDFFSKEIITDSLRAANVLKLNIDELQTLKELLDLPKPTVSALQTLLRRYNLQCAALTRGANGSVMVTKSELASCPGVPVTVQDSVGAGDSFTAAMAVGLLKGMPLDEVNAIAGKIAAFVCSRPGATPDLPFQLIREFYQKKTIPVREVSPIQPHRRPATGLKAAE